MSLCVQLQLAGVRVLIVGGGRIAYRKCCQLKQEGAELVVIAKQFDACFQDAAFPCITASYQPQQLQGHMLVIACCDDSNSNRQICEDAKQAGIFAMSVQQDCGASMHALAAVEGQEYVLAAGTKGASPLLAQQILKEMNTCVKDTYASRIAMLRNLRSYVLQHIQKEERSHLLSRLGKLSQHELNCVVQALQGKSLQLLCFHGVKEDVTKELTVFCTAFEQSNPSIVAVAAFLSDAVCDRCAQQSVEQWLQIVKPLRIPVTLVPMLFQNGRYYSRLLSLRDETVRVKPLMFQRQEEVRQCLWRIRRESGCINLLVIYHSCVNGAFCELLKRIMKEDVHFYAIHEKQTMNCTLPWREESVAILPMYMLRGRHYRKDSDGGSALVQSLQKHKCSVHILQTSCIELKPFQDYIIQKMME